MLEKVLPDLLLCIRDWLFRPEDQAAFALTCKTLYRLFNGQKLLHGLNSDPEARYDLLLQIAKDNLFFKLPRMVLCQWCRKFHTAYPTSVIPNDKKMRLEPPVPKRTCETHTLWSDPNTEHTSIYLPVGLSYNVVVASMTWMTMQGLRRGDHTDAKEDRYQKVWQCRVWTAGPWWWRRREAALVTR